MKYLIKRAIITNGEIAGYEILDISGKSTNIRVADMVQLIHRGLADGTVVKDLDGEDHIIFKEIDEQEEEARYIVEYRMIKNNSLVGYICKRDEQKKLSPSKLWELAAKGCVDGVKAVIINNTPTLISDTIKLNEIAVLRV